MVSITLSVPEEVRALMRKHSEINWSGLVRKIIEEKARELSVREEVLNQLKNEEGFNNWAVNLVRKGRKK